jgi:hypothetical protein
MQSNLLWALGTILFVIVGYRILLHPVHLALKKEEERRRKEAEARSLAEALEKKRREEMELARAKEEKARIEEKERKRKEAKARSLAEALEKKRREEMELVRAKEEQARIEEEERRQKEAEAKARAEAAEWNRREDEAEERTKQDKARAEEEERLSKEHEAIEAALWQAHTDAYEEMIRELYADESDKSLRKFAADQNAELQAIQTAAYYEALLDTEKESMHAEREDFIRDMVSDDYAAILEELRWDMHPYHEDVLLTSDDVDHPYVWYFDPDQYVEDRDGLNNGNSKHESTTSDLSESDFAPDGPHDRRTDKAASLLDDIPGLPDRPIGYYPRYPEKLTNYRGAYPFVELSLPKSTVKGTLIGKGGPRGVSESSFFEVLQRHCPGRVLRDHRVEFTGAKRDYEPDIILHIEEFGLRIDVEIDEPYSGRTRKPMHWLGSYDDDRDLYFSNNGWVVVRFAERQVVCQPLACVDYLIKLVNGLLHRSVVPRLEEVDSLVPVDRWSWEEAARMAANNERENYLGRTFDEVDEPDEQAIEFEYGLERERNSHGDEQRKLTVRDTGLVELPERFARLRDRLLKAIAEGDHALIVSNEKVFLLQLHGIEQRRARFFLRGFDVLSQRDVELELRRIEMADFVPDIVLRYGDQSNPDKLQEDIHFAIDEQHCLYIEYTSASSGFLKRTLSFMESLGQGYYFNAWCHVRNEGRQFRMDRIRSYKVLALKRPFQVFVDEHGSRSLVREDW